jgi:hypothetical protein
MGLLDLIKHMLGLAELPVGQPPMAQMTIISSESATQTSESQSSQARG